MKAIAQDRYGSPDVLQLRDVPEPTIADDTVLVRVHAVSLNAYDWHMMRGEPYVVRLMEGFRRPKTTIAGGDVAGVVEAVGSAVTEFQPGDAVFGARSGALAELVAGRERNFVLKPADVSFEQAAAVPTAALTGLLAVRDKAAIVPGQRVLVTGAGGGVGSFTVQIAVAFGADVTAATRTANVDMVKTLGARRVIDSSREDYTRMPDRYDVILDVAGNRSMGAMRRALTPTGTLVFVGGRPGRWIGPFIGPAQAAILGRFTRQRLLPYLASHSKARLVSLHELLVKNQIRAIIDLVYPFAETAAAMRHLETGAARGKVVIRLPE